MRDGSNLGRWLQNAKGHVIDESTYLILQGDQQVTAIKSQYVVHTRKTVFPDVPLVHGFLDAERGHHNLPGLIILELDDTVYSPVGLPADFVIGI